MWINFRKLYAWGLLFVVLISLGQPALGKTAAEYLNSAQAKYVIGDLKGSLSELDSSLAIQPNNSEALQLKTLIMIEQKGLNDLGILVSEAKKTEPLPFSLDLASLNSLVSQNISLVVFLAAITLTLLILLLNHSWFRRYVYCSHCNTRNRQSHEFCQGCGGRLKQSDFTSEQKRWYSQFGWKRDPFMVEADCQVFAGRKHDYNLVLERLTSQSGYILVIGGLGTGKSCFLRKIGDQSRGKYNIIFYPQPPLYSRELAKRIPRKKPTLLIIDEAQDMNDEVKHLLCSLGNHPNVILVLGGQPGVREKLKVECASLFDRIVETVLLGSLTYDEAKELILGRISYAGGKGAGPFVDEVLEMIYKRSDGIPREVLKICDWLVSRAISHNKDLIEPLDVEVYSSGNPSI